MSEVSEQKTKHRGIWFEIDCKVGSLGSIKSAGIYRVVGIREKLNFRHIKVVAKDILKRSKTTKDNWSWTKDKKTGIRFPFSGMLIH